MSCSALPLSGLPCLTPPPFPCPFSTLTFLSSPIQPETVRSQHYGGERGRGGGEGGRGRGGGEGGGGGEVERGEGEVQGVGWSLKFKGKTRSPQVVEIVFVDDEVSQERSGTLYEVARISLYPCMHACCFRSDWHNRYLQLEHLLILAYCQVESLITLI